MMRGSTIGVGVAATVVESPGVHVLPFVGGLPPALVAAGAGLLAAGTVVLWPRGVRRIRPWPASRPPG